MRGLTGSPSPTGALVLALGADPIHIPVAGSAADRVRSVNDLGDYTAFRAAMGAARRIAVMGAGLIGCEFANDLTHAGIAVCVIEPASWPLIRFVSRSPWAAPWSGRSRTSTHQDRHPGPGHVASAVIGPVAARSHGDTAPPTLSKHSPMPSITPLTREVLFHSSSGNLSQNYEAQAHTLLPC